MKAKNYSGAIKTFFRTPKSYGNIIGGFDLLSDSDLESHGFYDVITPSYTSSIEELGNIEWDASNSQFTYPVDNKTWSETLIELKELKVKEAKEQANYILIKTDWVIIRDLELGGSTPQAILNDRAAIRTTCANHETAINAKTTKPQVQSYNITY
jgi:hypothetical protein